MKIGIDIGGSHISAGIVTEEGKIIKKLEQDISFVDIKSENKETLIRDTIVSLINNVTKEAGIPVFIIEEIGIGVPGIVENNIIKECKKFEIQEFDLAKELEEFYKINVKLKNDAECAATAEFVYGNLKDVNKAVFLCLGTGIGGATIIDNKVYPSEYGHMIIEKNGRQCHCTNKGCYETYCSMRAFKKDAIKTLNLDESIKSTQILEILQNNLQDEKINEFIDEYTENLITGISNIINTINPEVICFGGGFIHFQDVLYKRLLEKIQLHKFQYEKPKIILAKLQNDAGIIGAAI